MKSRVFTLISLCALFAALFTASAVAQTTPGQDVYNPNGEVLNVVQGGEEETPPAGGTEDESTKPEKPASEERGSDTPPVDTPVATASSGDSLPFTGFEAGLVALAGVALLGAGFAMRRVARNH